MCINKLFIENPFSIKPILTFPMVLEPTEEYYKL